MPFPRPRVMRVGGITTLFGREIESPPPPIRRKSFYWPVMSLNRSNSPPMCRFIPTHQHWGILFCKSPYWPYGPRRFSFSMLLLVPSFLTHRRNKGAISLLADGNGAQNQLVLIYTLDLNYQCYVSIYKVFFVRPSYACRWKFARKLEVQCPYSP